MENSLGGKIAKALGMEDREPSALERAIVDKIGSQNVDNIIRVTDAIVSVAPGTGAVKDIYEAATGHNIMTGEQLSAVERGIAIFGVVTLGSGTALIRGTQMLSKAAKIAEQGKAIEQVVGSANTVARVADKARDVDRVVSEAKAVEKATESVAARYAFNSVENPGPLAHLPGTPAAGFRSGMYNQTKLTEDLVLYRGGDASNPWGQWFTRTPPESVAHVRIDSAVKPQWIDPTTGALTGVSPVNTVHTVTIPKGTVIYEGPAAYQGGVHVGGGNQIFVQEPWKVPGANVVNSAPLSGGAEAAAGAGAGRAADVGMSAATPVGRLGNPMEVGRGTNAEGVIAGRQYGGHALDQMQGRGVIPSAVENTIRVGTPSRDPIPGRMRFYDATNNLTVITESNGRVVTVITGKR